MVKIPAFDSNVAIFAKTPLHDKGKDGVDFEAESLGTMFGCVLKYNTIACA